MENVIITKTDYLFLEGTKYKYNGHVLKTILFKKKCVFIKYNFTGKQLTCCKCTPVRLLTTESKANYLKITNAKQNTMHLGPLPSCSKGWREMNKRANIGNIDVKMHINKDKNKFLFKQTTMSILRVHL